MLFMGVLSPLGMYATLVTGRKKARNMTGRGGIPASDLARPIPDFDRSAGPGSGERRLNGAQTTGRSYLDLSPPVHRVGAQFDVSIPVGDGTRLLCDVYRPRAEGRFPALVAFSPYPRKIQNSGAPLGFVEAGASDFFVPRGYASIPPQEARAIDPPDEPACPEYLEEIAAFRGSGDRTTPAFEASRTGATSSSRRVTARSE